MLNPDGVINGKYVFVSFNSDSLWLQSSKFDVHSTRVLTFKRSYWVVSQTSQFNILHEIEKKSHKLNLW